MRLLKLEANGAFSLVERFGNDVPRYAILSHTWGADHDELSLQDIQGGLGKDKLGYRKLEFCYTQAKQHGLEYCWVDTCCIDKTSNNELSEAINSMFQWYRRADRCYVYLTDVSTNDDSEPRGDQHSQNRWKPAFRKSRWFTRGWTLQELIAPASVEFFSAEGQRLGDKSSLQQQVQEITGIPALALGDQGISLKQFTVDQRLSWAASRQTKRDEDAAYCLLGIFDIQMPLLYGEGQEKALARLKRKINKAGGNSIGPSGQGGKQHDNKIKQLCQWLSAPDPNMNYQKALKLRQPETGTWLIKGEHFRIWKRSTSFLWLYGIPGCGKTVLSSTVIESICHNLQQKEAVAYFYFDFNDREKQDPEKMVRSLVTQLLQQAARVPQGVDALFEQFKQDQRQQLSLDTLLQMLQELAAEFTHAYIVIDALDECVDRRELLHLLEQIHEWKAVGLHVLLTSRKESDIETCFAEFMDKRNMLGLHSELVDRDIAKYIHQRLSDDRALQKWRKNIPIRQEIETALQKGACGMFRWAVCQLDALEKCLNKAMIRKALSSLPSTLDATYDRILTSIDPEYTPYTQRVIRWLAYSARPLSTYEIAEIVAIDSERVPAFNPDEVLEDTHAIYEICPSLVAIVRPDTDGSAPFSDKKDGRVVQFAHYSVKEYVTSDRIFKSSAFRFGLHEALSHTTIAKCCLQYLLLCGSDEEYINVDGFPLARYAAEHWIKHTQLAAQQETLDSLIVQLLANPGPLFRWLQLYDPDHPFTLSSSSPLPEHQRSTPVPLYYAAQAGLYNVVHILIADYNANVNTQHGLLGNALQAASYGGHGQVVALLLNSGAHIDQAGGAYGSALHAASSKGHVSVLQLLLNYGANVNAHGGSTALHWALDGRHEETALLLLNNGATINEVGEDSNNTAVVLHAATAHGFEEVVRLLLLKGADVNRSAYPAHEMFDGALESYQFQLMLLEQQNKARLLEARRHREDLSEIRNMRVMDTRYNTAPLYIAAQHGYERIVRLLLEHGAEVNAQGGLHGDALGAALDKGEDRIVELLIAHGAQHRASMLRQMPDRKIDNTYE